MAYFQPVWPAWPPYSCLAREYAGVMPLNASRSPFSQSQVHAVTSPNTLLLHSEYYRILLLERSVFDLVEAHKYLALTDAKLLGWYLGLTLEDRRIIQDDGGFHQFLQKHPALEVSPHHVYVRYYISSIIPVQSTVTSNKPPPVSPSTMSGATTCRSEPPNTDIELEMLPNHLRETLSMLGCSNSRDESQKHPTAFNRPTPREASYQQAHTMMASSQLHEQTPMWQMSSSSTAVCKDSAALKRFSLDMDQGGQPELRSQTSKTQGQSANCEVTSLQSECPSIEKYSPEFYSSDSIQMDGPEYSDRSILQPVEQASSPLLEISTNEGCQDHMVYGNAYLGDDKTSLSFGDQSDNFHSIMENDENILACLSSKDGRATDDGVHSGPVSTGSEALAAKSEPSKSDQVDTAEKHTCTEPALCMSAATQTKDPETADKHVITEVHMADLDYLAEEFIKLRTAQEELREHKETKKSLGGELRKQCDCIQRAQKAELCLLALQYSMCKQHCWRLYYNSAEGGQLIPMPENPSSNFASVLQKLESDYNQMKDKILAGFPLEQLKPLSVDSEKISTGASYIPAQLINDELGKVPSWSSQEPQKCSTSDEEKGCSCVKNNSCQHGQGKETEKQIKMDNTKAKRAAIRIPQNRDAIHNACEPDAKQTTAACQGLSICEAWYDAEEVLDPAGPAVAAETGQDPAVIAQDFASEEVKSSLVCVSNLPSNVTESDVMLWFEKYQASEVSISALKEDMRVAIVMINEPQSAEAAVRELHGCSMPGHTLHVEHINRTIGGSQASASVSGPESSQDAKPQTSKTSTERKLISQPLLSSSIKNRKVVCISPTAKGTCVPQHFGTMGSFDTLMAELTQRHPDVGRQRIVDALMELKAQHRGVLSGLPLRVIGEMTSELLTRPASSSNV